MKKVIIAAAAALSMSAPAFADGFVCEAQNESLKVKVFHQTQPELGTRNSAILVLSNPEIQAGRKTIATFESDAAQLTNEGATYTANVDLRFRSSNRRGELVGPTKLGEIKHVVLDVDFSYARPVAEGTEVSGELTLLKRNGEQIDIDMVCTRYLKGE
jgi:hypothetical protein